MYFYKKKQKKVEVIVVGKAFGMNGNACAALTKCHRSVEFLDVVAVYYFFAMAEGKGVKSNEKEKCIPLI